jgi:CRP/FNR family transcriptional regulator, cyclic AMP receptor protein
MTTGTAELGPTRDAMNREGKRAALMASGLFQVLRPEELDLVLAHAGMRRYPRNAILMRKGDPSTGMAVIVTGRVRVGSADAEGREVTLTVLGPGEVLGEIALIDDEPRSADVVAIDECVALTVDRARFLHLLRGNVDLCLRLMRFLCTRLRRANAAMEELALRDLPGRLGGVLLRLARDYGKPATGGTRIELRLSQKDLGSLIGASREKVNRQLRRWEQEGVLAFDGGHIVLRQPERLVGQEAGRDGLPNPR